MFAPELSSVQHHPRDGSGTKQNRSFGEYFDRLPITEIVAVQLSPGTFDHRSQEIWGQNSVLVRDRLTPLSAFTMVPEPDWVMVLWPHRWSGDFRVNGDLSGERDVFLLDGGPEWFTSGIKRDTLSLGLKRKVLTAACAALKGVDVEDFRLGSRVFANDIEFCALLQRIHNKLLTAARRVGPIDGRLVMPASCEADMISALAQCLVIRQHPQTTGKADLRSPAAIVSAVQGSLRKNSQWPLALSDLCKSAGVGRTRLHECFLDVYGLSPGQYLKKLRLTRARERLIDPFETARSVKDVALDLGFLTSGRFALEYREMFGELPRETLSKQM